MADIRPDDVYGRAQGDAAFLQRVREAHVGQWDVLDALWWESRPLDVAPSGTPAPAAELRELQRRLFSQGGDAGGDEAITAVMRELEATIAAERKAIKDAIQRAFSASDNHRAETDADVTRLLGVEQFPESGDPVRQVPPMMGQSPVRQRNVVVALSIVAALVGGVVVGTQVTGGVADAVPPAASAAPVRTASPASEPAIAPLAVDVFDRAQEPTDIPDVPLPATLKLESFRGLSASVLHSDIGSTGIIDMETDRFYAARTVSNLVCLVGVVSTIDYVATCSLDSQFPATGLRLYWPGTATLQDAEGNAVTAATERYTVWHPDGSLEGGSMGHQSAAMDPGTMS